MKQFLYRCLLPMALVALVITSCWRKDTVYNEYLPIDAGWWLGDTLIFELPPLEDSGKYCLSTAFRYTEDFPYTRLCMIMEHNLADSVTWVSDTLVCALRDKNGLARGKGLVALYQLSVPVGEIVADGSSRAVIRFRHGMKDSLLVGLHDVGVRIERCR